MHLIYCLRIIVVVSTIAVSDGLRTHAHSTCGSKAAYKTATAATARHRAYAEGTLRLLQRHAAKKNVPAARHSRDLAESSANNPAPIRFQMDHQISGLAAAQQQLVKEVTAAAVTVLQQYIQVKAPVVGALQVSPLCVLMRQPEGSCLKAYPDFSSGATPQLCGLATLKQQMFGSLPMQGGASTPGGAGVATDYYLLVTAQQDSKCSSANAWASHCFQDLETGRPLLGTVNICPDRLADSDRSAIDRLVPTLLHELFHAIGFSDALFGFYQDQQGRRRMEDQVVRKVNGPFGLPVSRIVSPRVVAEARSQFGCPSLEGADLEDEGGDGTSGSHWEFRLFQGDLMCASTQSLLGQPPQVSRLTLALMEDSGWYVPLWDAAGELDWGKGASCPFATDTCDDFAAQSPSQPYFCSPPTSGQGSSCTADGRAIGTCTTNSFTNGCHVVQAYNSVPNCAFPATVQQQESGVFGFDSGAGARCTPVFYPMVRRTGSTIYTYPSGSRSGQQDAMCYQMSCTPGGLLVLDILGQQVPCPTGQMVNLATHPALAKFAFSSGQVGPCPDNSRMCSTMGCPGDCGLRGECHDGRCTCSLTATGSNCETSIVGGVSELELPDSPTPSKLQSPDNAVVKVDVLVNATTTKFQQLTGSFLATLAALAGVQASAVRIVSAMQIGDGARAAVGAAATSPSVRVTVFVGEGSRGSAVLAAYQKLLAASANQSELASSFQAAGLDVVPGSFQVSLIAGESGPAPEGFAKRLNRQTSSIGGVAGLAGIVVGGAVVLTAAAALTYYLASATRRHKRTPRRPSHRQGAAQHSMAQHGAAQHAGDAPAGYAAARASMGPRVADAVYVAAGVSPRGSPRSRVHHSVRQEPQGGTAV